MGILDDHEGREIIEEKALAKKEEGLDEKLVEEALNTFHNVSNALSAKHALPQIAPHLVANPRTLTQICIELAQNYKKLDKLKGMIMRPPVEDCLGAFFSYLVQNSYKQGYNNFELPLHNAPMNRFIVNGKPDDILYVSIRGDVGNHFASDSSHAVLSVQGGASSIIGHNSYNIKVEIGGKWSGVCFSDAKNCELIVHTYNQDVLSYFEGENCKVYLPREIARDFARIDLNTATLYAIEDGLPEWAIQNGNSS